MTGYDPGASPVLHGATWATWATWEGTLDGDTILVSILDMTSITSKELHEQTGALLDRVKQGQRFRVLRGGEPDALLVPANDQVDPSWDEIMAEVRKARAQAKPLRPNPVLTEREKRHYAARLRR
jgi:antitoxin (DNA-binding transcriptional repressor) of toxin-antitoxin stability system